MVETSRPRSYVLDNCTPTWQLGSFSTGGKSWMFGGMCSVKEFFSRQTIVNFEFAWSGSLRIAIFADWPFGCCKRWQRWWFCSDLQKRPCICNPCSNCAITIWRTACSTRQFTAGHCSWVCLCLQIGWRKVTRWATHWSFVVDRCRRDPASLWRRSWPRPSLTNLWVKYLESMRLIHSAPQHFMNPAMRWIGWNLKQFLSPQQHILRDSDHLIQSLRSVKVPSTARLVEFDIKDFSWAVTMMTSRCSLLSVFHLLFKRVQEIWLTPSSATRLSLCRVLTNTGVSKWARAWDCDAAASCQTAPSTNWQRRSLRLAVKYKELSASFSIAGSKMMGFSSSTPPEPSYLNFVSSSNGKVRIFALCLTVHQRLKLTCWISRFSKARGGRQMVDWIFRCTPQRNTTMATITAHFSSPIFCASNMA